MKLLRGIGIALLLCSSVLWSTSCVIKSVSPLPSTTKEAADTSCSYFYFLWGSHAETNRQYESALEAYEKALICDPNANYVKLKIPVLLIKMGETEKGISWLQNIIDKSPDDLSLKLFLANIYIQQQQLAPAVELYLDIISEDPENEPVKTRLAILYTEIQEYDKAKALLQELLEKNKDSYLNHLALARLLRREKKYSSAFEEYEKALQLNWSKDLAYEIGSFYSNQKEFKNALRIYTTVTENDKQDEAAAFIRIQALLNLEKNQEALAELKRIKNFSTQPEKIELFISKVYLRQKKLKKARNILKRLSNSEQMADAKYILGVIEFEAEKYQESLQYLADISPEDKYFEDAVYLQVRQYKLIRQMDKAVEILQKHIREENTNSPFFYVLLASIFQEQKKYEKEKLIFQEALDKYPENYQLLYQHGLFYERNNQTNDAMDTMLHVIELHPDHAEALNFVGYTWADKNVNLQQAFEFIKKANELSPNNGHILDSMGWIHYRLGEFAKAVDFLESSLSLESKNPYIYDHLGDVYKKLNHSKKALKMYKKAFELFTDKKKKQGVAKKIEELTQD